MGGGWGGACPSLRVQGVVWGMQGMPDVRRMLLWTLRLQGVVFVLYFSLDHQVPGCGMGEICGMRVMRISFVIFCQPSGTTV